MEIAVFHPWFLTKGGAERLIINWAKRSRHDIAIFTWLLGTDTYKEVYDFEPRVLVRKISGPLSASKRIMYAIEGLRKRYNFEDYDGVVVSILGFSDLLSLRTQATKPLVGYVHTPLRIFSENTKNILKTRFDIVQRPFVLLARNTYAILERLAWSKYSALAFNSRLTLKRAAERGLIKQSKKDLQVIWPGVDVPKNLSLDKKESLVVYISRFSWQKHQLEAIKAWKILRKNNLIPEDYKLVLAGAITNERYFHLVKKYAEKDVSVEILPNLSEKEKWDILTRAKAFLFLAENEDFGISPLEAMAAGAHLITLPGGFFEVFEKIGCYPKQLLNPENLVESLVTALETFVSSEDHFLEHAKMCRKRLLSLDLSWDRFTREMDVFVESKVAERL